MQRNIILLVTLSFCLFCSCEETVTSNEPSAPGKADKQSAMIEYLRGQRLPALKSVEAWDGDYGAGLKLVTEHYEVYTTLLDPLILAQVPGFVESSYRGYQKQLPEPIRTSSRFKMYLFADRAQWEKFTDKFTGPQARLYKKIKAGAYYHNGACVSYNIGRDRTFSVLAHEGWHQFNSRHFKYRLPSWLDEGIAMMFEATRYENGLFFFDPSQNLNRLGGLKHTLLNGKMIPLRRLVALNPGQVVVASDDAVTAFYSESYALVRFLKEDDYGKRLSSFQQMLLGGIRGTWPLDPAARRIAMDRNIPLTVRYNEAVGSGLFRTYIGEEFEQIQQEYVQFCRKLVYNIRIRE